MHKITVFGIVTALLILAVCIGTATAYTNYETVWSSSGNQIIQEDSPGMDPVNTPIHQATYLVFSITSGKVIYLVTPFVNTITMTGTHPKVRYLYFQLNMPVDVNVNSLWVYSGSTCVYSSNPNWLGTGTVKDYTLDMGSYKDMVRGIQPVIRIQNNKGTNQIVYSYGAGARWDW